MKKRWIYISTAALLIIGVILGAFVDFNINKNIFDLKNGFGLFMSAFGEAPVYAFMGVLAYGYVFLAIKHFKETKYRFILFILAFLLLLASVYFQGTHIFDVNAYETDKTVVKILGYGIALVIFALGCLGGHFLFKTSSLDKKQMLFIIVVLTLVIGLSNGANQLLKIVFSRPRYRVISNGIADFTNWWDVSKNKSIKEYLLKNFSNITKEEFKSFPSGHMTNSFNLIFILPMLPVINNHIKIRQEVLFLIAFIFNIVLAYTRMRLGAHYLSDVCFGSLIATIFIYVGNEIYLKNKDRFVIKQEAAQ